MALAPTSSVDRVMGMLAAAENVTVREVVDALLTIHPEYAGDDLGAPDGVRWPSEPRTWATATDLLHTVDALYLDTAHDGALHGRLLLAGAGLADLASGRAMVRSGLFRAVARELSPPLPDVLNAEGRALLRTIPLAVAESATPITLDHHEPVNAVGLRPDGHRVVTVDVAGRVALWNRRVRREIASRGLGDASRDAIAVTADGQAYLLGDAALHSWRLVGDRLTPSDRRAIAPAGAPGVSGVPNSSAASTNGALVWLTPDGVLRVARPGVTDVASVELTRDGSPIQAQAVGISPGGDLAVVADVGGTGLVVDTAAATVVEEIDRLGPPGPTVVGSVSPPVVSVGAVAIADDGTVMTSTADGLTRRPPPDGAGSGRSSQTAGDDALAGATHLAYSPTEPVLAGITSSGEVLLVETAGLRELARLPVAARATTLTFSADGHWLAVAAGSDVALFAVGLRPTPLPPAPPVYAADDPDARTDLLGVDDEVRAFASLVAAVDVLPPLAIGVFGEWGSGKTFFIRRLRREVAELSADARASRLPQAQLGFFKHVVQVEFNAWHYAEGDLLASLVTHLFSNLEKFGGEDRSEVARRRDELLELLERERREREEAGGDLDALADDERRLLQQLDALRVRHRDQIDLLRYELAAERARLAADLRKDLTEELVAVGIGDEGGETLAQLRAAVAGAREEARHGAWLLARPPDVSRTNWLLRWLLGGVALAALVLLLFVLDGTALAAAVLTAGGAVASVVGALTDRVRQRRERLAEVEARIESEVTALDEQHAGQRAALEAGLATTRQRMERLETTRVERARRESELRRKLSTITPSRVLADYVVERAGSDDYRSLLGVHSLIHRDFRVLTDLIERSNRDQVLGRADAARAEDAEEEGIERRINRIVLYIDDLDRCRPEVVVEVIEAVHLLLAFPLFVVVVAADPQWVAHALETVYPDMLLRADGDATSAKATAYDYLEKIFQVPYWVASVPPGGVGDFVVGLTGGLAVGGPGAPEEDAEETDEDAAADGTDTVVTGGGGSEQQAGTTGREPSPAAAGAARVAAPDLSPERLRLTADELATLEAVGPLLGRSPRRIKRFVNIYRLVRATKGGPDFAMAPDGGSSASQVVATLLAIVTGMHASAQPLFASIEGAGEELADLGDLLHGLRPDGCTREDWDTLRAWVGVHGPRRCPWPLPLPQLRDWVGAVARYSFAAPRHTA